MHREPAGSEDWPARRTDGTGDLREHQVDEAFVDLTRAAARLEDPVGLLDLVTAHAAALLGVTAAGLLLADGRGLLHVAGVSPVRSDVLEVLQAQRGEGPCLDCFSTGRQVLVDDLAEHAHRWPGFVPRALESDLRSIHTVPVRLRTRTLGALALLAGESWTPDPRDLALAQDLADVAGAALVRDPLRDDEVTARLQTARNDRIVLEQAAGFLAQSGDLDVSEAHAALRRYARSRDLGLTGVARAMLTSTLPAAALLEERDTRR